MRELPCSSDSSLPCPVCIDTCWNVDELVTKCNMSPDEELFFKNVAIINKRTNDLKKGVVSISAVSVYPRLYPDKSKDWNCKKSL